VIGAGELAALRPGVRRFCRRVVREEFERQLVGVDA
jgi:hypothetical protein